MYLASTLLKCWELVINAFVLSLALFWRIHYVNWNVFVFVAALCCIAHQIEQPIPKLRIQMVTIFFCLLKEFHWLRKPYVSKWTTVFPRIVSAETVLF